MRRSLPVLATLLALTFTVIAPRPAHAGIILTSASGGSTLLLVGGIAASTIGAYTAIFSVVAPDIAWFYPEFAIPGGVAIAVLDKKSDQTEERAAFAERLSLKYPTFENPALFRSLTEEIYRKLGIASVQELTAEKSVHFTREELLPFFEAEDLRGKEVTFETLVGDFR